VENSKLNHTVARHVFFCLVASLHYRYFLNVKSEHLFNLRFAAKDLERNAKKSEKLEKEEKVKLKKVLCDVFVVIMFHCCIFLFCTLILAKFH